MRRVILALLSFVLLSFASTSGCVYEPVQNVDFNNVEAQIFPSHIYISHNDNFSALGFPGTGSSLNPYRIEGLFFDLENEYANRSAIQIVNTTAHFVIQDCEFIGYSELGEPLYDDMLIFMKNVTNGIVRDNKFNDAMYGVFIDQCDDILVERNNFTGMPIQWIGYDKMGRGIGTGGTIEDYCKDIRIRANRFENCSQGVLLQGAQSFTVSENVFIGCGTGISAVNLAAFGTIELNHFLYCSVAGVECAHSMYVSIINNTCAYTLQYGIWLNEASRNSLVTYNLVSHCGNFTTATGSGIWIHDLSPGNNVTMNDFVDNVENAINDNGGTVYNLNFFSDYTGTDEDGDGIGEDPYLISGDDEANDPHPRVLRITQYLELIQAHTSTITPGENNNPEPLFVMLTGVCILVILVIYTVHSKRSSK